MNLVKMKKDIDVFVGIPCYGGVVGEGAVKATHSATHPGTGIRKTFAFCSFSILTRNFNILYAQALNSRANGTTHFCMLHSDITPEPFWLSKMLYLMNKNSADILSVVSPLKDGRGLTSTAIDTPMGDADPRYRVRRLTLEEIHDTYPPTFTDPKLLINTGLMLVRFDKDWAEKLWFEFNDAIVKDKYGKWKAAGMSEDWNFSRKANALGLKIFATREVAIHHMGQAIYSNGRWGSLDTDSLEE